MRFATLFHDLVDFCFAAQCAACDAPATGSFLCDHCSMRLDQLAAAPACECCAMPLAMPKRPVHFVGVREFRITRRSWHWGDSKSR